jgi:bleomycin hydrolase
MKLIYTLLFLTGMMSLHAQYVFDDVVRLDHTAVKSQDKTGTCWSYATTSFIESELIRLGQGNIDLSEMFFVRNIYKDKARNYVLRQGKANFSQGALAHDMIRAFDENGAVPESIYSGKRGNDKHNHSEMARVIKATIDAVMEGSPSQWWPDAVDAILDAYMGEDPANFEVNGKTYTPKSYGQSFSLNLDDYVNLTSFTHHPFYESFVLEIPDNYSNGSYYNLPLDEMMTTLTFALNNGFTVSWDGDVGEKGFGRRAGLAVLPTSPKRDDIFESPGYEVNVTQELRQHAFESYATTDDHLMHMVGLSKDQNDVDYLIVKNSWGEVGPYNGIFYMSIPYAKMKTVSIMVHKDAVPENIRKKLNLK